MTRVAPGGTGRRLSGERGQAVAQVTVVDDRRVAAGGGDRGGQPLLAVAFTRPDQAGKPADVIVAGDIQGVEVQPGPPGDLGDPVRQGHRAVRLAGQDRGQGVAAGDPVPGEIVGVAVEQQREPGAGADLDQGQRRAQLGQGGQQRGAPGRLVGLGSPGPDDPGERGPVTGGQRPQPIQVRRGSQQRAGCGEQQVRLALFRRQRTEETQDDSVLSDRGGQLLVDRAAAAGLLGERPVVSRGAQT